MERVIRERMGLQAQEQDKMSPNSLINIRPVVAAKILIDRLNRLALCQ